MKIDWKEHSDKIMAIAATVTAVAALIVAVLEVRGQQEFQKLSVEPYVELANTGSSQIGYYAFLMTNNGLGPAAIKSAELWVDGVSVDSWNEAVRITIGSDSRFNATFSGIYPNRRIKAAERIEVFKISPYTELAREFHNEMNSGRVDFETCYCSIYEDCWKTSYKDLDYHVPVERCESSL